MAYEIGGRADKYGNQFEYNWTIYKLLEVIEEKTDYIILENIGEYEEGVDLWIGNKDGSCEGQQCKGRNGSQESKDSFIRVNKTLVYQICEGDEKKMMLLRPNQVKEKFQ